MTNEGLPGLTTTDALRILYDEISSLRSHIKQQQAHK